MNNQENAPMYKKVDPKDCSHSGYYVPLGYKVFRKSDDKFQVVYGILCIRCGNTFNQLIELLNPDSVN